MSTSNPYFTVLAAPENETFDAALRRVLSNVQQFTAVFEQQATWIEYERVLAALAVYLDAEPHLTPVFVTYPSLADFLEQELMYACDHAVLPGTSQQCVAVLDRYFL
jgi:hypothetical protein